jgi:ribonuclease D
MRPVEIIQSADKWRDCLAHIATCDRFAVDLESNGLYAYREQICLLQISTDYRDFVIDPLAPLEWQPLGDLLADPSREKVFHACEYDLILLKRQHDFNVNNLFDTMWAARILGYERIGLASMLESLYGLQISKANQRANWCQRPLRPDQLAYAQGDTHYLMRLRDDLALRLEEEGHDVEAAEIFAEQIQVRLPDTTFDPDDFWSINGIQSLTPRQRAILRELNITRDAEARQRNLPPFKVLGNRALLAVAQAAPNNPTALRAVPGLSATLAQRYGTRLLEAVRAGNQAPLPKRTLPPRRPQAILTRYERLQTWRKEKAEARGVSSDVIISREAMWALAEGKPANSAELAALNALGPWRLATYGPELLALLRP